MRNAKLDHGRRAVIPEAQTSCDTGGPDVSLLSALRAVLPSATGVLFRTRVGLSLFGNTAAQFRLGVKLRYISPLRVNDIE